MMLYICINVTLAEYLVIYNPNSGFSRTTTSKICQIRRMPSSRGEGTTTTVKRRGCKQKLRKTLGTLSSPSWCSPGSYPWSRG
uniref:Uncharacterized protein n=1 Tax=Setaria italica TaxID=4555 RepID=K3ZBA7_SETIT